jgi:glycosyltransferase involved in cell wall biosynthesis
MIPRVMNAVPLEILIALERGSGSKAALTTDERVGSISTLQNPCCLRGGCFLREDGLELAVIRSRDSTTTGSWRAIATPNPWARIRLTRVSFPAPFLTTYGFENGRRVEYESEDSAVKSVMDQVPTSSLFLFHTSSNVGYAIQPLEALFYKLALEFAGGDPRLVHFGYRSFERGRPNALPDGFGNLITFDLINPGNDGIRHLARYAKQNKIKLVVTFDVQPVSPFFQPLRQAGVRTIVSYWGAPISSRMPFWKLALKRLEVAVSRSKLDGLIFESQAMADLAIYGRGVPRRLIDVVPLGVDTELFKPAPSDYVYRTLGMPRDRKAVIYSGHMEPRKGVRSLVEAAVELLARRRRADVCFLICGNSADQSKEYERMYAGMGLDNLIRFGGYRSDLREMYPSCFCGVIPSTGWDSFPRTSVEMAASGLPVVASRLQGLPEAVLDEETGLLFDPGNSRALADCLERLLDQPGYAARLGRAGRKRCECELNIQVQQQRLRAVLLKRLGSR